MLRFLVVGASALSLVTGAASAQAPSPPDPPGVAAAPHALATMRSRTVISPDGTRTDATGTTYQTPTGTVTESTSTTRYPPPPPPTTMTTTVTTTTSTLMAR